MMMTMGDYVKGEVQSKRCTTMMTMGDYVNALRT